MIDASRPFGADFAGIAVAQVSASLGEHVAIDRCTFDSFRLVEPGDLAPGVTRVGCCRISFSVPTDPEAITQTYAVLVFESIDTLNAMPVAPAVTVPMFGPAVIRLPERCAMLFAFPNDPGLPHLPRCLEPDAIRGVLEPGLEIATLATRPIKYDPGRGCTWVARIRTSDGRDLELVAKTHRGHRLQRTFDSMRRLAAGSNGGGERFARALGYDRAHSLLVQDRAPGRAFWELYPGLDVDSCMRAMAQVAASMHAVAFAPARRRAPIPDPGREQRSLAAIAPDLGRRHAELWRRLGEPPGERATVSLHGDLHPDQFLIDGDRVTLIDFDKACWGAAGFDVGCLVSHVVLKAIEWDLELGPLQSAMETFLDAYDQAGDGFTRASSQWHVGAHLLSRRTRKLIERGADPAAIARLLDVSEGYVERSRRS